jgi:hypothetical protein
MNKVQEQIARKRLGWVDHARLGILAACGDDVVSPTFHVRPTVDPLKFILKITLKQPLAKATRGHLRTYLRCWANEFGCEAPIINIQNNWVQAEVLTTARVWSRDAKNGRFVKGGHRFERRPR